MQYCYSNNGLSWRGANDDYVAQTGEVLFPAQATPAQLAASFAGYVLTVSNLAIQQQIDALEATATPRRTREAVLGTDGGWLSSLNTKIAALRAQLAQSPTAASLPSASA